MNLQQIEARLKSEDILERNLAIAAVIAELRRAYTELDDLVKALNSMFDMINFAEVNSVESRDLDC